MRRWLVTLLTVALGCASVRTVGEMGAPLLISPSRAEVFGEMVRVNGDGVAVVGEFLGCDSGSIYLRVRTDQTRWVQLSRREWDSIQVVDSGFRGTAGLWTGVGALSTLTHGFFLLISAPVWALVGGIAIGTSGPVTEETNCSEDVRAHARWPQGIPEAVRDRFVVYDGRLGVRHESTAERRSRTPTPVAPWDQP